MFPLIPVLFRLSRASRASEPTVEWLESFDVSCYEPMRGLLASEDFKFLSTQPGYSPSLIRKLRRDRLRIFRQYLDKMMVDFSRLYSLAALIISQSVEDQSALYSRMLKIRVRFTLALLRVECSYMICRLGTRPAGVDGLLETLNAMNAQLSDLSFSNSVLAN